MGRTPGLSQAFGLCVRAMWGSTDVSGGEWFILIVVVILIPLVIAVAVTLWTLEMARQRNRRNRSDGNRAIGVKRRATRVSAEQSPEESVTAGQRPREAGANAEQGR